MKPRRGYEVAVTAILLTVPGCLEPDTTGTDQQEIVGGTNANIADHPWQISLQTNSGFHFCGGSIVDASWVLTAQHCVADLSSDLRVEVGTSYLSGSGQVRGVDRVLTYPGYVDASKGKDVALLHLSSPLSLSANVASIELVTAAAANGGATAPGVMATVTGWGTLSAGGSSPDRLQEVDVPIVSNADAQSAYKQETITGDQLAAGYLGTGGKDSCQGDSGGPLTVSTSGGQRLAGVVSWGYGCADEDYPGMYARVSSFESWLSERLGAQATTPVDQAISGSSGSWSHYAVQVPAGALSLSAVMAGGSGDADLYVRFGSQPTTTQYSCRPYLNGNYEFCSIDSPAAGTWYVSVRGYSTYSGASLTVSTLAPDGTTPPPPPAEVCDDGADNDGDGATDCDDTDCADDAACDTGNGGTPQTFTDTDTLGRYEWKHYAPFTVSPGSQLEVFMDRLSRDPDLYVRFGAQPTSSNWTCRPRQSGDETCNSTVPAGVTQAYVSVYGRNRRGNNGYALTVTYTP